MQFEDKNQEKSALTTQTHFRILTISGATMIGSRWSWYHFEAKRYIYIWYEDIKVQFSRFHSPKVEIPKFNSAVQSGKQSSDQCLVFRSYLRLQSSDLDDSWSIGKLTQRATTFVFCTKASSAFMIEKIADEVRPKWIREYTKRDL